MKIPRPRRKETWAQIITAGVLMAVLAVVLVFALRSWDDSSTKPTNYGPFSDLVHGDIPAAGITVLVASDGGPPEAPKKGELYLWVESAKGQDAAATADTLLSLAQKYKKQLHLKWLRVVIEPALGSGGGMYERSFDLTTGATVTT